MWRLPIHVILPLPPASVEAGGRLTRKISSQWQAVYFDFLAFCWLLLILFYFGLFFSFTVGVLLLHGSVCSSAIATSLMHSAKGGRWTGHEQPGFWRVLGALQADWQCSIWNFHKSRSSSTTTHGEEGGWPAGACWATCLCCICNSIFNNFCNMAFFPEHTG